MQQTQVIDCGGVLDITVVTQWREQALAVLRSGMPLCLKANNLQRIDTAGLQAILGLIRAAAQQSISMQWDDPSPALQQAAHLIGLSGDLRLS